MFERNRASIREYRSLLNAMQRLRGQTYLADGAISLNELDGNGRFCLPDDEQCWHLLLVDRDDEVIGCVRYRVHTGHVTYSDLRVKHAALAADPVWSERVRRAVERELAIARHEKLCVVEIGGWALSAAWRHTHAALQLLAASYALGEFWGGGVGIATATLRHRSAVMLRRLGGRSLEDDGQELPPYMDSQYGCYMELLRFGKRPNVRFEPVVQQVGQHLRTAQFLTAPPAAFPAVA